MATYSWLRANGEPYPEGIGLVCPQRPVGEFIQGRSEGALGEHVLADAAGVHAGAAAGDVGAVPGAAFDHAVHVIVAVG